MDDFSTYILNEENLSQKMEITYYLSKKTGIFFDKSVVLKTEIAKLFIDFMKIDVDVNLVTTAMLLCNCKKVENAQKIGKLETYAKDGAEYLSELGFNKRFCKVCEQVNRYSGSNPRERESDILEVVDQFTGLILNRVEREAFTPLEAIVVLKERNLKYTNNIYIEEFEYFVKTMEKITIKETIDVPIIKKLVHLHNKEANVKTYIASLINTYNPLINKALMEYTQKKCAKEIKRIELKEAEPRTNTEKMKELISKSKNSNKSLFTEEIAKKILTHKSKYKIEE